MYKGFIIDDFDNIDFSGVRSYRIQDIIRMELITEDQYLVNDTFNVSLSNFIIKDSIEKDCILDGTKISDKYFPSVNADIFISHSHKDIEKAKEFAKVIYYKTGLKSFIDSEVWGYADDLLRKLDDSYCPNSDNTYSYEKRNISTSYVHMMLNTALLNMIDRCECLFFLNTPNSFNAEQEIKNTTFSPWIYSELSMANAIEKKVPSRYDEVKKSLLEQAVVQFSQEDSLPELKIAMKPKTNNLISCSYQQLITWISKCSVSESKENLDTLYKLF